MPRSLSHSRETLGGLSHILHSWEDIMKEDGRGTEKNLSGTGWAGEAYPELGNAETFRKMLLLTAEGLADQNVPDCREGQVPLPSRDRQAWENWGRRQTVCSPTASPMGRRWQGRCFPDSLLSSSMASHRAPLGHRQSQACSRQGKRAAAGKQQDFY